MKFISAHSPTQTGTQSWTELGRQGGKIRQLFSLSGTHADLSDKVGKTELEGGSLGSCLGS